MNFTNPLEILLTVILVLGSIWLIERIIAGAFKTVLITLFIVCVLSIYAYKKNTVHYRPLPKVTWHDFTSIDNFKKKYEPYEKDAIKDIEQDFKEAKKNTK